jgi:hypothetical protein
MKPGEPTTTLSRMKFLLSHVATANAGTYSDLHQLVMQEFERNHPVSPSTLRPQTIHPMPTVSRCPETLRPKTQVC